MNGNPQCQLEEARDLLRRGAPCRVHCMGAGGVGVAGLARLLKARDLDVSGCDCALNRLTFWLEEAGVPVAAAHDVSHAEANDWLIHTAAVRPDHPELLRARALGRPVHPRGVVLAALVDACRGIAIAGTHGKTTTTAMTAQILRHAGLAPAFCIGGEVAALGGVAGPGDSDLLVAEADESDGTLALYAAEGAVVTNVDFDHMEHFAGPDEFHAVFASFIRQAREWVCYGRDDAAATRMAGRRPDAVGFGFHSDAQVRIMALDPAPASQVLRLTAFGRDIGPVRLPVPGRYNAVNAAAATAVALSLGVPVEAIEQALEGFTPARRRLERFLDLPIAVYSDYAHHPAEIRALMGAAIRLPHRRLVAVFQPHRYTRTLALGSEFPPAFEGVDHLVLAPVYAAAEEPLAGGTGEDLHRHFLRHGRFPTEYASSLEDAWSRLKTLARPGDLLLVIGAGDVEKIAAWAAAEWAG